MQAATQTTIQTVIDADPTISPDQRKAILRACEAEQPRRRLGTVRQAAAALDVCPKTIQRYAAMGLLRPVRITARRVRYDLDEVERLANHGAEAVRTEEVV